jgi:hypothetical protein
MTPGAIAFLALVISAMAVFAIVVAWAERRTRH